MTTEEATIGLHEVLDDPYGVAEHLVASGAVYGLTNVEVRVATTSWVTFWLTLEPWAPMVERSYPTERVSISVWSTGRVTAVPVDPEHRAWEHRNPYLLGSMRHLGSLCLWFPNDPRPLRWEWDDGFVSYITMVHRHLQAEEYFRRNGVWPAEDAPHGDGTHPIRTPALQQLVTEGAA